MAQGIRLVVLPAKDLAAAKALYTRLIGVEPYVDGSYYVGYRVGDQEIGLDPHGNTSGPIPYWDTGDIASTINELVAAGATERDAVRDVGGGLLVASVTDPAGNVIGLRQRPENNR